MEVGQNIKKLREWKKYSPQYLAEGLGGSPETYAQYESGESDLSVPQIQQIATILEVSIAQIFEIDEKAIFNTYNVENSSDIGHNILRDSELLERIEWLYEARIEDLKKENDYLKGLLEKTLKT